MQEVITLLASKGGLRRIDELLRQPFASFSPAQLTRVKSPRPYTEDGSTAAVDQVSLQSSHVLNVCPGLCPDPLNYYNLDDILQAKTLPTVMQVRATILYASFGVSRKVEDSVKRL